MNLLIVGCGITGSFLSYLIRSTKKLSNINISIWDKGRGAGGRMSTKRYSTKNGSMLSVDLGAQYFSISDSQYESQCNIYDNLIENKVIREINSNAISNIPEFSPGTRHFVAANSSNSVVKYFLSESATMKFERTVVDVQVKEKTCSVHYRDPHSSGMEQFDMVVLTCPVPQLLQLPGVVQLLKNDDVLHRQLSEVEYSSRFALGLFYDEFPGWLRGLPVVQYIKPSQSDIIAYIALDTVKRNTQDDSGASICVHSRAYPFGEKNIDRDAENIRPVLMQELQRLYPDMVDCSHVICHKWRYSQVHKSYPGSPGCLPLTKSVPAIIVGGDALVEQSGLHHCLNSAFSTVQAIGALSCD